MTSCPVYHNLDELFYARIQALTPSHRYYRIAAHRFLTYLHTNFPQVEHLSDLRRDPHLLGWLRSLAQPDALSNSSRRMYLIALRRLLRDLASEGHALQPELIVTKDFPSRPPRPPKARSPKDRRLPLPHPIFGKMFENLIQTIATTLQPRTIPHYRNTARHFLSYLQTDFPELCQLSNLRRDPHLLGWLRLLCHKDPPLANITRCGYLGCLRRLFHASTAHGHALQPGLILAEDFPPCPQYLPRALSPENDLRLLQELRHVNDLLSNALLLTRATGIRIGECIDLHEDCLRSIGPDQWALHVPLGKLHTERLVPVDQDIRQTITRILDLRAFSPSLPSSPSAGRLLPRSGSPGTLYKLLSESLHGAARRAGCPKTTCHQLRHTYATEMIRFGTSLPALMKLLGHKTIAMTMRYVQVTQCDLHREFHHARQNAAQSHQIPQLSPAPLPSLFSADLPEIQRTLAATRHLLEMYRRQLEDKQSSRKLQRLNIRLQRVAFELDRFTKPKK
jgi:site-specific recombinase XerD